LLDAELTGFSGSRLSGNAELIGSCDAKRTAMCLMSSVSVASML